MAMLFDCNSLLFLRPSLENVLGVLAEREV